MITGVAGVSPPPRPHRGSAVSSSNPLDVVGRDTIMEPTGLDPPDTIAPDIIFGPSEESDFGSWLLVSCRYGHAHRHGVGPRAIHVTVSIAVEENPVPMGTQNFPSQGAGSGSRSRGRGGTFGSRPIRSHFNNTDAFSMDDSMDPLDPHVSYSDKSKALIDSSSPPFDKGESSLMIVEV